MFHLLQPKYRSCDRCHGLQFYDAVDDCWICLQCAERNYILTEDEMNEREMPPHFNSKGDVPVPCCINGECTCEPEDEEPEIEDEIEC
jgi:hypothetical protein